MNKVTTIGNITRCLRQSESKKQALRSGQRNMYVLHGEALCRSEMKDTNQNAYEFNVIIGVFEKGFLKSKRLLHITL